MDPDELLSRRPQSPLAQLVQEDLDALSVDELSARIEVLQAEIGRARARQQTASAFRAEADKLFRS